MFSLMCDMTYFSRATDLLGVLIRALYLHQQLWYQLFHLEVFSFIFLFLAFQSLLARSFNQDVFLNLFFVVKGQWLFITAVMRAGGFSTLSCGSDSDVIIDQSTSAV